ncbi:hypoxia inducible factor 1 subunit alpha, like [Nelusetta ayraudi]|uniref:hypoxia inducible factor 1 subunit alpha, like n=1 Tax=Nelusetta ayraudi TaxID=303726 RepID=UPI003F70A0A9
MEAEEKTIAVGRSSCEQRKLRSRDAARHRRSQETEVFYELANTLPLPRRVTNHLDKSGIMRVLLSFLRLRGLFPPADQEEDDGDPMDCFYPQTLAGFVMTLTEEGDVIYLTENVGRHIGIPQLDLLGQSVFNFVHPCDQEELRDLLTPRTGLGKKQQSERNFFLRMKSTLTSRGRTVTIKSAEWKVLHCTGHIRPFAGSAGSPSAARVMTLLCEPIPHPSSVEFPLDTWAFLTRHTMDLRFTHCEGRVTELVGYKPDDLIGRSALQFHHVLDSDHISRSLHTLLSIGQVSTNHYRFLANCGGFVWAETQATVLYNSKTSQPEAVVCLNFVLSSVEMPDVVFSVEQLRCGRTEAPSQTVVPEDCLMADTLDSNHDDFVKLSFCSPSKLDEDPERPQDLCTPQLQQLLAPIFDLMTPPTSSGASSCETEPNSSSEEETMDTTEVEKFFAQQTETQMDVEGVDLEMLAPYISMDDDFQLNFLSGLPEDVHTSPSSAPELPPVTCEVQRSRKRNQHPGEKLLSDLIVEDKRRRKDVLSLEEELFTYKFLDCLDETNEPDLLVDPDPVKKSHLLTDKDPLLGCVQ